jgi:Hypothetical glycosyl hydrolase family 15
VSRAWRVGLAVCLLAAATAVSVALAKGDAFSAGGRRHGPSVPLSPLPQLADSQSPQPSRSSGDGSAISSSNPVEGFSQWLDEGSVRAMSDAQWAAVARQNAIVVLNSWDYRLVPVLKAANPEVRVYEYKDLSGVRSDDCTTPTGSCGSCPPGVTDSALISSGMGYCWVLHNDPQWLLRSARSSQPLEFRGYPSIWETDYGNPAYLRQWLQNVLTDVKSHGWDGVEIDNALNKANDYGVASKYPTDQSVQAATYAALSYLGPQLRLHGVGDIFNIGYATTLPGLWQQWLGPVGGLMQEFYLSSTSQADAWGDFWQAYQSEVSSCAAEHKSCWFHTGDYSTTVTPTTSEYALASFLLATDGHQYLAIGTPAGPPVSGCRGLGTALGPDYPVGTVLVRKFSGGIVLVNPWPDATSYSTGQYHYYAGGKPASTVTLPPMSGAILGLTPNAPCP